MDRNPNSTKKVGSLPPSQVCSHCSAVNTITETLEMFYCEDCNWWGYSADQMKFDPDSFEKWGIRSQGQVPRRPKT